MSECECITIANANTSAKGGVGRGPVGGKRVRLCDTYVRYATQRARLAQLFASWFHTGTTASGHEMRKHLKRHSSKTKGVSKRIEQRQSNSEVISRNHSRYEFAKRFRSVSEMRMRICKQRFRWMSSK